MTPQRRLSPLEFLKVVAFVDANHVLEAERRRHGTAAPPGQPVLDGDSLFGILSAAASPGRFLRAYVYDGEHNRDTQEPEWRVQRPHLAALEASQGIDLRLGRVEGSKGRFRQKGVDTLLVLDMLRLAQDAVYDLALLVAGDADFVPVVDAVKRLGREVFVGGVSQGLSQALRNAADGVFSFDASVVTRWRT